MEHPAWMRSRLICFMIGTAKVVMVLSWRKDPGPVINPVTGTAVRIHSVPRCRGCLMKTKMVPIQFPPNIMEMLDNRESCPDENVGGACSATARSAVRRT
jgi:hypothetical protein